jgi:hypothetical protein
MNKNSNRVVVVINCPYIQLLKNIIIHEYFNDVHIDQFMNKRIEQHMNELLDIHNTNYITENDNVYSVVISDIVDFISTYVRLDSIVVVEYWYLDNLIIHCKNWERKDNGSSKIK